MPILKRQSDKIDLLADVPLFRSLPKKQLQAIARVADEVDVDAGAVLAKQGEQGSAFYVIVTGQATVRRNGRKLAMLGAGDFFGEMSLLDQEPRSATVAMDTDGVLLEVHRRQFSGLLDESPALTRNLLKEMSRRVRELDRRLVS
jgi:CRP-like cAMP-binding protein